MENDAEKINAQTTENTTEYNQQNTVVNQIKSTIEYLMHIAELIKNQNKQ